MADVGSRSLRVALVVVLAAVAALTLSALPSHAQSEGNPPTAADMVVDVRVVGNQAVSVQRFVTFTRTRAGRNFDPIQIEEDVRRLTKSRLFVSVNTSYQRTPEGIIVLFQVVERPTLAYVKYVGTSLLRSTMDKQTGLKVGDAVDPYLVDDARRKLEEYYHSKGFTKARVVVSEGNKPGDRGAVFLIHEGPKQKIYDIEFEGNTIADDARLKTQISSKTPILYMFRGEVDESKIDEDVEKLTAYYRSLGFFNAVIGRELEFGESGNWATLRFVINEGPRYKVNNVNIVGASKFHKEELEAELQLKGGKYFDQDSMTRDITALQDRYGGQGYLYAVVNPDRRLSETPGEMDLVYQIEEGAKYRVGRVDVKILGDDPHTRVNTILNRVDIRPGDIADIRKFREAERRLKASGLFVTNPAQGTPPTITWEDRGDSDVMTASRPGYGDEEGGGNYRGQSPDDYLNVAPRYPSTPEFEPRPTPSVPPLYIPPPMPQTQDVAVMTSVEPAPIYAASDNAQPIAGSGNPFVARRPRISEETALPIEPQMPVAPPVFQPSAVAAPPAADSMQVRFQSPNNAGSWGQVPLYSPAPGATAAPAASYGPPTQVVQTQYTAPAPSNSLTPVYTQAPTAPPQTSYPPAGSSPAVVPGPTFGSTAPAYAPPVVAQPAPTPYMGNAPGVGAPPLGYSNGNELLGGPPPRYPGEEPTREVIVNPAVQEAQTGRFMVGVGVNSNAGVVGSIILDEQNADITRLPTSWRDFIEGRAFRGAGQQVRIEAVPGTQVSRYTFSFRQPYLFDTRVQLGVSGYYFQRYYQDWLEERLGGRLQLGYQFPYVPDLSVSGAIRMEDVGISQPTVPTPNALSRVLGHSGLYVAELSLTHDTRDNTFLATEGHRLSIGFDQAFGDYDFSRVSIDARQHFLMYERPDRSGRHVLTLSSLFGVTGSATPIFENYFAGGFSSLRGFNFRGVGPYDGSVNVGGQFQWINSVEYMFPLAADDMIRGVVFCDFGTVEDDVALRPDNYRVSPGFGLRLTVPAMGPAPIALDFSVPVAHGPGDDIQNFAFYVGFGR